MAAAHSTHHRLTMPTGRANLRPESAILFYIMKTVPVEDRDKVVALMATVKPYVTRKDCDDIAAELTKAGHDVTGGTVAQTLKGVRFNIEVIDALTKRASVNKARLADLLGDGASREIDPTKTLNQLLKSGSEAENGSDDESVQPRQTGKSRKSRTADVAA